MKHCMKPTQEKSPAQIVFHIGTTDLVTKKDASEIANIIAQLTKFAKIDKNKFSNIPVDTRRRFNVYTTSPTADRRLIDVETTSCVYWDQA